MEFSRKNMLTVSSETERLRKERENLLVEKEGENFLLESMNIASKSQGITTEECK